MSSIPVYTTEADVIKEKEEVGFFFLKDTCITLVPPSTPYIGGFESKKHFFSDRWQDVKLVDNVGVGVGGGVGAVVDDTNANKDDEERKNCEEQKTHESSSEASKPSNSDEGNANGNVNGDDCDGDNDNDNDDGDDDHDDGSDHAKETSSPNVHLCSRCNLIIRENSEEELVCNISSKIDLFNGCMDDISCCAHHHKNENETNDVAVKQVQRSDSALLLGTILQCRNVEYLRVEKIQILLSGIIDAECEEEGEGEGEGEEKGSHSICKEKKDYHRVSCSLMITISLPHLERKSRYIVSNGTSSCTNKDEESIGQYDEMLTTNGRFEPFGQLLFSMIRCDWTWLDCNMERLSATNRELMTNSKRVAERRRQEQQQQQQQEKTSIFPSVLSLEELYSRIRGAASQEVDSCIVSSSSSQNIKRITTGAISLPDDLLKLHIAPFLRAKSLHNLRRTCRYMNHTLRGNVPGMKLILYPHQIRSLSWMRQREMSHITDDDAMQSGGNNRSIDEVLSGDLYRSITCGCIVAVTPREKRTEGTVTPFWHINSWTGDCFLDYRNDRIRTVARCRSVARGGLLCDDPGLGKTITILSLILQTFGQSTERENGVKAKSSVTNDLIIESYWRENLVKSTRHKELLDFCFKLRRNDVDQFFQFPVTDYLTPDEIEKYRNIVKEPICLQDVTVNVQNNVYGNSLEGFFDDIQKIFSNAKLYNSKDTLVYERACFMLSRFEIFYEEFRHHQLSSAISSQKRSRLSLGALISESKKEELLRTLLPSKGTLLVVPHNLIDHWLEQMKTHIYFAACSKKRPLIFRHKTSNKHRKKYPIDEVSSPTLALELCESDKTHFPFLFIDECNEELPYEVFLAKFSIVLTTTKRLTAEWKNGSFEEHLRKSSKKSYRSFNYDVFNEHRHSSPCPLLKVRWLRLVVDEGHSMGKKGPPTNSIDFSSWITSDYRWSMTGTPTPQHVAKNGYGLGNLIGLLKFLKFQYFSISHWGEERCRSLNKGLKEGHLASFFRLRQLLNLFMVRHTKKDVEQLHKPIFTMTCTHMSATETLAYDTLVSAVQMNLVTTSMKGKTSGQQDSLLNARQGRHAKRALSNIRLACSGGTRVVPTLTRQGWDETIAFMRDIHKANDVQLTLVENFLHRMTSEQLTGCMCCGAQLQTLFLLPCACQICTECVNSDTNQCLSCGKHFDVDDFQRLQPGIVYEWKWNIVEAEKERERERTMAESLRLVQNVDNADEVINGEQVQIELNRNNNEHQRRNQNPRRVRNEPHVCKYPDVYVDGKCTICSNIHLCNFMEGRTCAICHGQAEDCPEDESKAFYITKKLLKMWSDYRDRGVDSLTGERKRPLKVLIFTQFQQVSNLVGDRLIRRFGNGCIAEYWGVTRSSELERFTKVPDCFCLLLNRDGSHGLNLSFVTHIIFLDEIFDKSLESQVVSRAYRMGATENVFVEQLVSQDSIEELIVLLGKKKQDTLYANSEEFQSAFYGRDVQNFIKTGHKSGDEDQINAHAKVKYLLSRVKLIRRNQLPNLKRKASTMSRVAGIAQNEVASKKKSVKFNC